jgi:hypothetical protein
LKDFKGFPYPSGYVVEQLGNRLIYDELNYNADALAVEFQQLFRSLTGTNSLFLYYRIIYITAAYSQK